jgi:hypothetical protein
MTTTCLKRVGKVMYNAMLTESRDCSQWSKPTFLARFTEQNGASTMFTITGDALLQFKTLEKGRIYNIEVPGSCVKNNSPAEKFGVSGAYEVRLTRECKLSLAKDAWPMKLPYSFTSFADLNQIDSNHHVDIIGRVLSATVQADREKQTIVLENGEFQQEVSLFGQHAKMSVASGDLLAIKDAKIHEWKKFKNVNTSFLSVLEKNPTGLSEDDMPSESETNEPTRKAIKLNMPTLLTISTANNQMASLVTQTADGQRLNR